MPPIPVYTDSPIAASKASGVTPQTDQPPSAAKPSKTTATTTSSNPASYPSAQPGAAPSLPTPTATSQAYSYDGPPAPQPGATPVPSSAVSTSLPPPPKAGEKYQPPQQAPASQPTSVSYPQQMSIPAPTAAYPAQQHGTSTASVPGPTASTGAGFHSLQHPPGYHQNTNASELDKYQRAATQDSELEEQRQDGGGVWDSARKWAQQTGEKIAAAESEVWKKINKE